MKKHSSQSASRHIDNQRGMPASQRLLTVRQIAELDGCSERTVRRAIAAGLLDVVRIGPGGRLVRIHPAAHAAYRQTQQ